MLCMWQSPLCLWGKCASRLEAALGLSLVSARGPEMWGERLERTPPGAVGAWKHNISHLAIPPPQTAVLFTCGSEKWNLSVSSTELAPADLCWCNCLMRPCPLISSVSGGAWCVDLVFLNAKLNFLTAFSRSFWEIFLPSKKTEQL